MDSNLLRVAGAQIPVCTDIEANVETIMRAIDFAGTEQADILLTPEGSLSGYAPDFDTAAVKRALAKVTAAAARVNVGLALGTCFVEDDDRCYNQIRFYAPDGAYLGFHSKTLTCGSLTDPPRGEIEHYAVAPLRLYDWPDTLIGGLICNDLWANPGCTPQPDPHLTQQLSDMGARVIFHAVNGGRKSASSITKPTCGCEPGRASCGSSPSTIACQRNGPAPPPRASSPRPANGFAVSTAKENSFSPILSRADPLRQPSAIRRPPGKCRRSPPPAPLSS